MTHVNGNTAKPEAVPETQRKVGKHQECAGNTDFCGSQTKQTDLIGEDGTPSPFPGEANRNQGLERQKCLEVSAKFQPKGLLSFRLTSFKLEFRENGWKKPSGF